MDLRLVVKIIGDLFRLDSIVVPKADILTFACDNDRYMEYEGKKYSPLINTIEDELARYGLSTVSITRLQSRIKGPLSHGKVFSPEGGFARALLTKRLKGLFLSKKTYPYSFLEERVWEKILRQSEAKVVIGINPSRELCSVCHRLGVWVADIQHGVISASHPWYGENFRDKDPRDWIPDAFYCWDESSANAIGAWANKKGVQTVVIGNPWLNRFIEKDPDDKLLVNLSKKYKSLNDGRPNILLTFSWGCYNIPNEFIDEPLEKFILDTYRKYNWIIRLHPNQLQGFATDSGHRFVKYYKNSLSHTKIDWIKASAMPLPLLISNAQVHVSWNSSVCLEAAFMGVRSLLLDPELLPGGSLENNYNDLVAAGYADKLSPSYEVIKKWVEDNLNRKMAPYEKNNLENYQHIVQDLVKRAKK